MREFVNGSIHAYENVLNQPEEPHQEKIPQEKNDAEYKDNVEQLGLVKQHMSTENLPCARPISQQLPLKNTKKGNGSKQQAPGSMVEFQSTALQITALSLSEGEGEL